MLGPPPRIPRMLPAPLRNTGALKAAPRASSLARTKSRCPDGLPRWDGVSWGLQHPWVQGVEHPVGGQIGLGF